MHTVEISQADTRAWTKCQPQATVRGEKPLLIITGRNHAVSWERLKIHDICGSGSQFPSENDTVPTKNFHKSHN